MIWNIQRCVLLQDLNGAATTTDLFHHLNRSNVVREYLIVWGIGLGYGVVIVPPILIWYDPGAYLSWRNAIIEHALVFRWLVDSAVRVDVGFGVFVISHLF